MSEPVRGFLVRHAQSKGNATRSVQGQAPGIGLTPLGVEQADRLAASLAELRIPLVLSSDLQRTLETAAPVVQSCGARLALEPALRERNYGELEGRPWSPAFDELIGLRNGRVADVDVRPPGGESIRELYDRVARVLTGLAELPASELPVVLISHGGPIRCARAYLAGEGPDGMAWGPVDNATATAFRVAR